jgi:serine/threonine protein phosphatase PrpC
MSYQEAVDFVAASRGAGKSVKETTEFLVKTSLERKTLDNVTAIVVFFSRDEEL